jgi:hypothetical protein
MTFLEGSTRGATITTPSLRPPTGSTALPISGSQLASAGLAYEAQAGSMLAPQSDDCDRVVDVGRQR